MVRSTRRRDRAHLEREVVCNAPIVQQGMGRDPSHERRARDPSMHLDGLDSRSRAEVIPFTATSGRTRRRRARSSGHRCSVCGRGIVTSSADAKATTRDVRNGERSSSVDDGRRTWQCDRPRSSGEPTARSVVPGYDHSSMIRPGRIANPSSSRRHCVPQQGQLAHSNPPDAAPSSCWPGQMGQTPCARPTRTV